MNLYGNYACNMTDFLILSIWFQQPRGVLLTLSFTYKLMVQQLENHHLKPQHKYVCKLRRKPKHLLR